MVDVKKTAAAAKNYAGVAALITSMVGAAGLLLNQANHQGHSDDVQASVFAVFQYRVEQLELRCPLVGPGTIIHDHASLAPSRPGEPPRKPPAAAPAPAPVAATTEVKDIEGGLTRGHRALRTTLHRKLKANGLVGLDDLRDYVQKTGQALDMDFAK